jgi:hypothetical protein
MSGATTPETPRPPRGVDEADGGGEDAGGQEAPPTAADAVEAVEAAAPPETAADAEASAGDEHQRPRRFMLTKSTARPEGGGRAMGGDASVPARQWPVLTITAVAALGLVLVAADVFRAGVVLIGAALLGGAALRWLVPSVGMLAVRSRFTDVITYAVLGSAIVLLALMAQPDPIVEIPLLEDVIRFSVR